ncbi:MAG: hypothetical protein ACI90V_004514 [Bacillariaceae sp.]|jgi:hypothetical protein
MDNHIVIVQSLPICCTLAALGGALEVAATAVTAIPAVRAKEGIEISKFMNWFWIVCNVTLQLLGSVLAHLFATWFGPTSMVVPFFFSSILLCNITIVGLLKEPFNKNMRVGTFVIVVSVILLPAVGPTIQENQNLILLMSHWYSLTWFLLLLTSSLTTSILLAMDITQYNNTNRTIILIVSRASSLCVNLTVSRALILQPSTFYFVALVTTKVITGFIYTSAIVVQSFAVEQSRFVPLNATLIILMNSITGIIIWEDWRVVQSWLGYLCVFTLLGLGCDLLLSTPQLNNENPLFGLRATLRMNNNLDYNANSMENDYYEDDDGNSSDDDDNHDRIDNDRTRRSTTFGSSSAKLRRMSGLEAWKETVGSSSGLYASVRECNYDTRSKSTATNNDNHSLLPTGYGSLSTRKSNSTT